MRARETHHLSFAFRRWVSVRSIYPTGSEQKETPAGHADASFAVSSDGGTGQPGPAPCVAGYTAYTAWLAALSMRVAVAAAHAPIPPRPGPRPAPQYALVRPPAATPP